jgi:hypothetical protein
VSKPDDGWRGRSERERREKARRLQEDALRRLRRRERAALAWRVPDGPLADRGGVVFDSERFAAPLSERLGPRERVQILLWGSLLTVGACALVSFFSAPLMDFGLAMSAVLVGTMLILSYVM